MLDKISDEALARRLRTAQDRRMAAIAAVYGAHSDKVAPFSQILEILGDRHRAVREYRLAVALQRAPLEEARRRLGRYVSIPELIERLKS